LKTKIATLQRRHPDAYRRKICGYLDAAVERGDSCEPLKSWQERADGKRTWVELYDDPRSKPLVQMYLSKVSRNVSVSHLPVKHC